MQQYNIISLEVKKKNVSAVWSKHRSLLDKRWQVVCTTPDRWLRLPLCTCMLVKFSEKARTTIHLLVEWLFLVIAENYEAGTIVISKLYIVPWVLREVPSQNMQSIYTIACFAGNITLCVPCPFSKFKNYGREYRDCLKKCMETRHGCRVNAIYSTPSFMGTRMAWRVWITCM